MATFRNAVDAIHHLDDEDPPWQEIISTARDLVGADSGTLIFFGKDQELRLLRHVGIDSTAELEYRQRFHKEDTVAEAAKNAPAGVWLDSTEIFGVSANKKKSSFYDYMHRSRIGQIQAFIICNEEYEKAAISFQRITPKSGMRSSLSRGAVAEYTETLMKMLNRRRQALIARFESIESVFSSLGEATFLATQSGIVWRLSPLADELLRAAKMISDQDGVITHPNPLVSRRIRNALSTVAKTAAGTCITVPVSWGEVYRMDISPATTSITLAGENSIFVRVRKLSVFGEPNVDELRLNFSITPTEARILAALTCGHTLKEYAAMAGVSERTVRIQISSILRKMDCSRQSELVRLASLVQN